MQNQILESDSNEEKSNPFLFFKYRNNWYVNI